jgi:hypothetical protein
LLNAEHVVADVQRWLERIVVGLNLCPFAKQELRQNRIRFSVSDAMTERDLLVALEEEALLLEKDPTIETTLLVHPCVLENFLDYNQFLDLAEALLRDMQFEGVYQIASFHPDYQFAGTQRDDAENFTNRSPYPILHLLREESLDRVLATTEHAEKIPARNIQLMKEMGTQAMTRLLDDCISAQPSADNSRRS